MKISVTLFLASIGSASAFVAPSSKSGCSALGMSDPRESGGVGFKDPATDTPNAPMGDKPPAPKAPQMSKSIPFMNCPSTLDGTMAGDVGFDPLGFAKSKEDLAMYREAEIKHARLAMLAAAGWPVSELFDKKLANLLGMEPLVNEANQVPSVLNGGMLKVSPFYWVACLGLAAAVDVFTLAMASKKKGYYPGNLGFDPFGLYPKEEKGQKWMRTAEIKNGRLAMIAITGFAFQEFALHTAVIDQTPLFFKPITEVLFNSGGDAGYFVPAESVDTIVDAASSASSEAAPAAAESAATIVDAYPSAPAEAATAIPPAPETSIPPVGDSLPAASAEAATNTPLTDVAPSTPPTPVDTGSELEAAKKRIAELEAQLSTIQGLSQ